MEAVYDWMGGPDLISAARLMRDLEFLLDDFDVQHFLGSNTATSWSLDAADNVAADLRSMATNGVEVSAGRSVQ